MMKKLLTSIAILMFMGAVQVEAGGMQGSGMESTDTGYSRETPQSAEVTAQEPGIGDRESRFERDFNQDDSFGFDNWTNLHNEDVYGSF